MPEWIELTREKLYELVWQKATLRLAAEYSMSGRGLAKLCARHDIPTPPRGYWALLAVGRAPAKPRLPTVKNAPPIRIRVKAAPVPKARDELAVAIQAERQSGNRIVVADRLLNPCPIVEQAREALQGAKVDDLGRLDRPSGCLALRVSRTQLPRALRIADALLKSFEARGWGVAVVEDKTIIDVDGLRIALVIEETLETEERPAKPDLSPGYYRFHYKHREVQNKLSGWLMISIHEEDRLWNHAQQRNWRESEKKRLEDHLNDVVVGLLKLVAALGADRSQRKRAAQEEEERQRKRQALLDEQARLRKLFAREKAAVSTLRSQAARWRESRNVRLFVQAARDRGRLEELNIEEPELTAWAEWALRHADRLDPFEPSPPSILDDAERIEHMCDGLAGYR